MREIPSLSWNFYSIENGYDALLYWMVLNPSEDGYILPAHIQTDAKAWFDKYEKEK